MHERIQALMKYYRRLQKGVLPFVFGVDIFSSMTHEELYHIPHSHTIQLNQRMEHQRQNHENYKDALE